MTSLKPYGIFWITKGRQISVQHQDLCNRGSWRWEKWPSKVCLGFFVTVDSTPPPVEETPSVYDDILGESARDWMAFEM